MSVRTRFTAATVAAAAMVAAGAVVAPAMAAAATAPHAAPALPLNLTVVRQNPSQVLMPNGAAATAIVTVVNSTGSTQKFTEWADVNPNGPLNLDAKEVVLRVAPLGTTPKSLTSLNGAAVAIPGHTTYTWKVTLQATRNFPANDVGFGLRVGILAPNTNPFTIIKRDAWFHVGTRSKPGYIIQAMKGATTLGPRHAALETFTVTNHSGARIDQALTVLPMLRSYDPNVTLALDEWVGPARTGHWQPVRTITVPRGLANGATYTAKLRLRVTHDSSKAPVAGATFELFDAAVNGEPAWQVLTVLRND